MYAGDTKRASDVEESDSIREGRRDPPFIQRNSGIFAIEKRSKGTILKTGENRLEQNCIFDQLSSNALEKRGMG